MGAFDGRVAIVTGSGQGIGRDIAIWLAREGCKVVTNNRKKGSSMQAHEGKTVRLTEEAKQKLAKVVGDAETTAAEICAFGGEALPVYASVSNPEDCKRLVDAAIEKWGRVDILVNNAASTWTGNIKYMTPEIWDVNIQSKLSGSFYLMHYALPYMVKQHYGRILNCASNAFVGLAGMAAYSSASCGVWALTKSAAQDLIDDNILVNCYTPLAATRSWINTEVELGAEGLDTNTIRSLAPPGMQHTPERMVSVLAYMASEEFPVTGVMFKVEADGSLAVWSESQEYNQVRKDVWRDGEWTFEEMRERFPKELFQGIKTSSTSLVVEKAEY